MKKISEINNILRYLAIIGNVTFVLWILYNCYNEGFVAIPLEKISYIGLIVLLVINTMLLSIKRIK